MRILLTGATGFLGNNLLRMLLDDGHELSVTVRQGSDRRPIRDLDVEPVVGDLADNTEIIAAVSRVDLVIHSAAMIQIGWSKMEESRKVNVQSTLDLARAARLKKIRMIHVSTVDALAASENGQLVTEQNTTPAKPACAYVASKREAESAFLEQVASGLDGVIVNPGFMVGPWDWKPSSGQMILAVAKQFTPLAPSGGCSVADVRDVACGILSAIDHGRSGERYILAGKNTTYFDLWCQIAQTVGARGPVAKLPKWLNRTAGSVGDVWGNLSGREPLVNSAATQMGAMNHWYSSQKAEQELGYQIGCIETALADAWTWFQAHGYC